MRIVIGQKSIDYYASKFIENCARKKFFYIALYHNTCERTETVTTQV